MNPMTAAPKFLYGYRALDLTGLSGQLCGRILADLGMEVVKIEPPGGDPVRQLPPFIKSPDGKLLGTAFAHLNAGKASKVIDLKKDAGRELFRGLVEKADVVLESFSPGELDSLGLGYQSLAAVNSGIVMASITGFGQTGPKKDFAYTDLVALALSGFLYISGDPSSPPCKPPETQAYYFASLFGAVGVLAALYRRERTGRGDHVDVSMQEALATQEHIIRLYANEGQIVTRQGSQHGQVAPARIFPCRDGYVYLYVTRQHWKPFLEVWKEHPADMDAPEWLNNLYRRARADTINSAVTAFTRKHTTEELTNLLQPRGIPCVRVNTPLGFTDDEHVQSRGFMSAVDHFEFGTVKQPAAPFVIGGARPVVATVPVIDSWRSPSSISPVARETPSSISPAGATPSSSISPAAGETREGAVSDTRSGRQGYGPLAGMRIVSFDHVLAGPYGTTILAELGADVIKVESRRGGMDPFRFFGTGEDPNLSPRFLEFNRNKRSLTINLKHPDGPKVLLDLVRHADAVLDNYSVDVMTRLGIGYDDLCKVKPDIINLRMPGLGCTGPKKHYSTVGTNITSFTGLTYLWNHPANTDPPIGSQTVYPDYVSGVMCATIIIAGALYRDRYKKGAFIDLAQAEATAYMIGASLMEAAVLGHDPQPLGNRSLSAAPHGCYPCEGEDRWCAIAVESDDQWFALAQSLGLEVRQDRRFDTREGRLEQQDELDRIVEQWTRQRDPHEVMTRLQRAGVPCGVVQTGADLVADDHLKERGFIVAVENPRLGRVVLPNFPLRFANARLTRKWEFPELGRDSVAVLRDVIGYSEETIAAHQRDGVLE
jgi:crotonobetainyl-CoA:carnitine CoA-transferase CaiB-like acyl-CoA transferase